MGPGPGEPLSAVRRYYDRIVAEEDRRLGLCPFELHVTLAAFRKAVRKGARVLDAACGTGRYGEALLKAGYRVGLGDLSPANVQRAGGRTARLQPLFLRAASVLDPEAWEGGPWDAVLMLGPLYHLPKRRDRLAALRLARRSLKPGGLLFSAWIGRMAPVWDGCRRWPEGALRKAGVRRLLRTGAGFNFARKPSDFEGPYFCRPDEIAPTLREAGFGGVRVLGTEGPFGGRAERWQAIRSPRIRRAWLDLLVEHAEDPGFVQGSEHILAISRKAP